MNKKYLDSFNNNKYKNNIIVYSVLLKCKTSKRTPNVFYEEREFYEEQDCEEYDDTDTSAISGPEYDSEPDKNIEKDLTDHLYTKSNRIIGNSSKFIAIEGMKEQFIIMLEQKRLFDLVKVFQDKKNNFK
jgi:hypothetical protein